VSLSNPPLDLLAFDDESALNLRIWLDGEVGETTSILLPHCLGADDGVFRIHLHPWLGLAVFSHHLQQFVLQRLQALARNRGDNKDGPSELFFEVFFNEFR